MSTVAAPSERVAAVRAFNRFYTRVIGVLDEGLLETPYSLAEARVLFELGSRVETEVVELRRELDVDPGYMSRILARLEAGGLVVRERSASDARRQTIRLTRRGRAEFRLLDRRSAAEIRTLLARLPDADQRRLVAAQEAIRALLDGDAPPPKVVLRPLEPGDLGWVVERHGALYAQEYDWDVRFEALVARIVADFGDSHDDQRERAWIAEAGGRRAGCIFCVRKDESTAQLRLLLVDPSARGTGIGGRLVDACVGFARGAGYERITLWTNDVLADARRLYERAGFELVEEEPQHLFGHDLVSQVWTLRLS